MTHLPPGQRSVYSKQEDLIRYDHELWCLTMEFYLLREVFYYQNALSSYSAEARDGHGRRPRTDQIPDYESSKSFMKVLFSVIVSSLWGVMQQRILYYPSLSSVFVVKTMGDDG
jgi:hypothetical protein